MELQLRNVKQDAAGARVQVSDAAFGCAFNEPLVHQVVVAFLAGARAGTHAQKSRSEVSGSGAKPWRQKGTGQARAGSFRSPLWRHGGVTFAAKPSDYSQKVNKKMYRGAMRAILSELVRQDRLVLVDDLRLDAPKTKQLLARLKDLGLDDALIVTSEVDRSLALAARNLPKVEVRGATQLDPVSLIKFEKVLMTVAALKRVEEWLA